MNPNQVRALLLALAIGGALAAQQPSATSIMQSFVTLRPLTESTTNSSPEELVSPTELVEPVPELPTQTLPSQPLTTPSQPATSTSQLLTTPSLPPTTPNQPLTSTSQLLTTSIQPQTTSIQPQTSSIQPLTSSTQPPTTSTQPPPPPPPPPSSTSTQPPSTPSQPQTTTIEAQTQAQPQPSTMLPQQPEIRPESKFAQPQSPSEHQTQPQPQAHLQLQSQPNPQPQPVRECEPTSERSFGEMQILEAPIQKYAVHLLVALSVMTVLFVTVSYLYLKKSRVIAPITSYSAHDNPTFTKLVSYYANQPHVLLVDENSQNYNNDVILAKQKNSEVDKASPLRHQLHLNGRQQLV